MTAALIAGLLGALAVIGLQTGLTFYAIKRGFGRGDRLQSSTERAAGLQRVLDQQEQGIKDRDGLIATLHVELDREIEARNHVAQQRNKALDKLAELDDPDGVAAAIRGDIDRLLSLSRMSETAEVSDVPDPAPSEDS